MGLAALTARLPKCVESRVWSLGLLILAATSFPFVAFGSLCLAAFYRVCMPPPTTTTVLPGKGKTAIITGGKMSKAMHMARILKRAGCRVVMVETHKYYMVASRFSKSIDRFVTVPVPEKEPEEYVKALKVLAYEEDADLFVPVSSPVASVYDARIARVLPPGCASFSPGETMTAALDDKVTFSEMAQLAGCPTPETRRMTSKQAVHAFNDELRAQGAGAKRYILKNLQYDSMHRLDLFSVPCEPSALSAYMEDLTITPEAPWACQQFITGPECCGHVVALDGKLSLYSDNVASISCFNYEHLADARIRAWVSDFCAHHKLSGIMCFDFIVDEASGVPYAIECNPRMSSNIVNFYDSPTVGRAFVERAQCAAAGIVETPSATAGETNWTVVDLYYALAKPGLSLTQRLREVLATFACKKDAYYDPYDVLPFLALHYVHIPTLLARNVWRGNRWAKIDMCIGKLTEENGD
jgi:hypothetical protein